ncbi:MAG TPA: oxygenase MpaB family protein [Mycobacteriales bacterium]|nr:oxygenase MpaB family protein [Mycobacteriales bacterium]
MDVAEVFAAPKALIRHGWLRTVGADGLPGVQFTDPPGDPGLYGPDSAIWYVHGDVAGLVGGLAGLLLGGLHQPTIYGTNQHSSYSDDPLARLGRTASFVNAMTWGSMPVVERTCGIVRTLHRQVRGTMPDGRAYSADDPEQLVWTAVTQAHCIMLAHQRYHPHPVTGARIDEYYAEYSQFALRLGAPGPVPSTRDEVTAYFERMRPQLCCSEETANLADFFRRPFGADPASKAASLVITRAAFDVLPDWARRLYGERASVFTALPRVAEQQATRRAAQTLLAALRWSLGEPRFQIEARARCLAEPTGAAANDG